MPNLPKINQGNINTNPSGSGPSPNIETVIQYDPNNFQPLVIQNFSMTFKNPGHYNCVITTNNYPAAATGITTGVQEFGRNPIQRFSGLPQAPGGPRYFNPQNLSSTSNLHYPQAGLGLSSSTGPVATRTRPHQHTPPNVDGSSVLSTIRDNSFVRSGINDTSFDNNPYNRQRLLDRIPSTSSSSPSSVSDTENH